MSAIEKLVSFVTGGLPTEIVKQVGENIKAKGENAFNSFMAELGFSLEQLKAGTNDPLHTRQIIAITFHFFMWGSLLIKGHFPQDIIFKWGETEITVGFVYVVIIFFYFPFRAWEKSKLFK